MLVTPLVERGWICRFRYGVRRDKVGYHKRITARLLFPVLRANAEHRRLLAAALERIPAIEAPPETSPEASPEQTEWPESAEGTQYGTSPKEAQESLHNHRPWYRNGSGSKSSAKRGRVVSRDRKIIPAPLLRGRKDRGNLGS